MEPTSLRKGFNEESRKQRRFNTVTPIPASLAQNAVDILNLGGGGMQIEHSDALKVGTHLDLCICFAGEPAITPLVRVAWSRLSRNRDENGKFRYRSGLAMTDASPSVIGAIGRIIRASAKPDAGSLERKREALEMKKQPFQLRPVARTVTPPARPAGPLPPCFDAVRETREYFAQHRDEASKWYSRARYSLAAIQGFHSSMPPSQQSIAIWERLGGKIDLNDIVASIRILEEFEREP